MFGKAADVPASVNVLATGEFVGQTGTAPTEKAGVTPVRTRSSDPAFKSPLDETPGRLGGYRIIKPLGQGSDGGRVFGPADVVPIATSP